MLKVAGWPALVLLQRTVVPLTSQSIESLMATKTLASIGGVLKPLVLSLALRAPQKATNPGAVSVCDHRLANRHSLQFVTRNKEAGPGQSHAQGDGRQCGQVAASQLRGSALPAWPVWKILRQSRTHKVALWPSDLVPKTETL